MQRMGESSSATSEGALAEFSALRQEIERRSTAAHTLFALQLSTAAIVFSFAAAMPAHRVFLLVIPFGVYVLGTRYVDQQEFCFMAARYITEELRPRVRGGFGWEAWLSEHARKGRGARLIRVTALWLTFPAVAAAALGWSAGTVFSERPAYAAVGLIALWVASWGAVAVSGWALWKLVYSVCRHPSPAASPDPEASATTALAV
ncbi:hypothetical protein PV341_28925 [Streptomyces sp. PA03-1a]|nr:hypothetical protein [Streptomyces sp. PA03-1a]